MTTKTYALLDTHAVGPLELLDIGRTVITCAVPGTDYARAPRARRKGSRRGSTI